MEVKKAYVGINRDILKQNPSRSMDAAEVLDIEFTDGSHDTIVYDENVYATREQFVNEVRSTLDTYFKENRKDARISPRATTDSIIKGIITSYKESLNKVENEYDFSLDDEHIEEVAESIGAKNVQYSDDVMKEENSTAKIVGSIALGAVVVGLTAYALHSCTSEKDIVEPEIVSENQADPYEAYTTEFTDLEDYLNANSEASSKKAPVLQQNSVKEYVNIIKEGNHEFVIDEDITTIEDKHIFSKGDVIPVGITTSELPAFEALSHVTNWDATDYVVRYGDYDFSNAYTDVHSFMITAGAYGKEYDMHNIASFFADGNKALANEYIDSVYAVLDASNKTEKDAKIQASEELLNDILIDDSSNKHKAFDEDDYAGFVFLSQWGRIALTYDNVSYSKDFNELLNMEDNHICSIIDERVEQINAKVAKLDQIKTTYEAVENENGLDVNDLDVNEKATLDKLLVGEYTNEVKNSLTDKTLAVYSDAFIVEEEVIIELINGSESLTIVTSENQDAYTDYKTAILQKGILDGSKAYFKDEETRKLNDQLQNVGDTAVQKGGQVELTEEDVNKLVENGELTAEQKAMIEAEAAHAIGAITEAEFHQAELDAAQGGAYQKAAQEQTDKAFIDALQGKFDGTVDGSNSKELNETLKRDNELANEFKNNTGKTPWDVAKEQNIDTSKDFTVTVTSGGEEKLVDTHNNDVTRISTDSELSKKEKEYNERLDEINRKNNENIDNINNESKTTYSTETVEMSDVEKFQNKAEADIAHEEEVNSYQESSNSSYEESYSYDSSDSYSSSYESESGGEVTYNTDLFEDLGITIDDIEDISIDDGGFSL